VISGLSGSGKSCAVKTLEDLGYYCVDNLPVPVLKQFLELTRQSAEEIGKLALVIDARDKRHIGELPAILKKVAKDGFNVELLFLEASDEVLSRRFSETRHRHHLSPSGSPLEGVAEERKLLEPVRKIADVHLDTSEFSASDLRKHLTRKYGAPTEQKNLFVTVTSFGFKHGLPIQADLVFDVRFLANPFFRPELKSKSGTDAQVVDFVMGQEDSRQLITEIRRFLEFVMPRYEREGKSYLTLAIGCTGGRHRSVVIAEATGKMIEGMGHSVRTVHRDLERA
jgi:RNase adapter protein RapZ